MRIVLILCCVSLISGCKKETLTDRYNRFYKECMDMESQAFRLESQGQDMPPEAREFYITECSNTARTKAYDGYK